MMFDTFQTHATMILVLSCLSVLTSTIVLAILFRVVSILARPKPKHQRPAPSKTNPTHLLVVLGSGGHTAEMLNILSTISDFRQTFTYRTYVVSSGDSFSAVKASEFEETLLEQEDLFSKERDFGGYSIATVRRARKVHQSFLTAPWTTLLSLWDCVTVLRGTHPDLVSARHGLYPDLILTNGPGTGVCVVLASIVLLFFGFEGSNIGGEERRNSGQMRSVFIESWARVKTLSLSGKILKPLVGRCLVQWLQLADLHGDSVEYMGPLVS